jgi:uncharacterized SAM-binding protein YcdF (DUF218 family)
MKTFRQLTALFIVFVLLSFGLLFLSNMTAKASAPETGADALVVLGCGLYGAEISQMLKLRLDKALEYYADNPDTLICTSGGQGRNELVPEALAMRDYLVSKGVPDDIIIMEDRSTSTKENFLFSKEKLDARFGGEDYTAVFITNDFHILRSGIYAERAGITARGIAAPSVPYLLPSMYLREYLALMKYYVIDAWGL